MKTKSPRRGEIADLPAIEQLWDDARTRLQTHGIKQWQYPLNRARVESSIRAGECWVIEDEQGGILGTITIDDFADPDFWKASDYPQSAAYVHRMIVASHATGNNLGARLLNFAASLARAEGKPLLRLDAWRTNTALHSYYLGQGFRLVRIVAVPNRNSGALFERSTIGATVATTGRRTHNRG